MAAGPAEIPMFPRIAAPGAGAQGEGEGEGEGSTKKDKQPEQGPGSDIPITQHPRRHEQIPPHRFLTSAEWSIIASGLGGVKDGESHKPFHPKHWLWPTIGMPQGLYREVVSEKNRFYHLYHMTSILRLLLMILQLLLGAALTSLGAMSLQDGRCITILGAVNTVIAGCLALLHNSGLPDRYWKDMAEFEDLEDRIKEILDCAIVPVGQAPEQVLAECFGRYRDAKSTVAVNMPSNYASNNSPKPSPNQQQTVSPPPAVSPDRGVTNTDAKVSKPAV